jgi:hypothetical protein
MPEGTEEGRLRRRAADQEGHVEVNVYKFLSDLADLGARTGALERNHEELRREVRDGNAANAVRIAAVESHLARQDIEIVNLRQAGETWHAATLDKIEHSAKEAVLSAARVWNTEHAPLLAMYESIAEERRQRRQSQRRVTRIGYAVLAAISGVLAVLVAGGLNRLTFVPNAVYLTVVILAVVGVMGLAVFASINQDEEEGNH